MVVFVGSKRRSFVVQIGKLFEEQLGKKLHQHIQKLFVGRKQINYLHKKLFVVYTKLNRHKRQFVYELQSDLFVVLGYEKTNVLKSVNLSKRKFYSKMRLEILELVSVHQIQGAVPILVAKET